MAAAAIPNEFLDPEGDAESQDPDLGFETTTARLRKLWAPWVCRSGSGRFADPSFFGRKIGGVPEPAVAAYAALEAALKATGYAPDSRWAYNCRKIGGSNNYSLHAAGIAIDIDPQDNPFSLGDPYAGKLQPRHVAAVLAIKNGAGRAVWSWGGDWSRPDRMHFQLDRGPSTVDIDWSTVPGGVGDMFAVRAARETGVPMQEEGSMLQQGSQGPAVARCQERLRVWNPEALPRWGVDGDYGDETVEWVGRFQSALGLAETGVIDGVTAALLLGIDEW